MEKQLVTNSVVDDKLIKQVLTSSKTVAMVGVSSVQKKENSTIIRRRPSIIVMKYLQEFGYKVIPVNPFSEGKKVHGETIVGKLEDVSTSIDIVNVFRPSKETPEIAKQAVKVGAKALWLQDNVVNVDAAKLAEDAGLMVVMNDCMLMQQRKLN